MIGLLLRKLVAVAATVASLAFAAAAGASVGVNVNPGWGDTIDGRNVPQMWRNVDALRPSTLRMAFVRKSVNPQCVQAWRDAVARGIQVVLIDDPSLSVETEVGEIAAEGLPVYLEGQNEPDGKAASDPDWQAKVRDRQTRLYALVDHRFPVLVPAMDFHKWWDFTLSLPGDILNTHTYSGNSSINPPIDSDAALPPSDGRPVWVTEIGWKTYKARQMFLWWTIKEWWVVTEAQQRDWLVQLKGMLEAHGASRVFVYKLTDDGTDIYTQWQNWGLFKQSGAAKLAVAALRG